MSVRVPKATGTRQSLILLDARPHGMKRYECRMSIPPAALVLIAVALGGAAVALAAFVWAVRDGQLDPTNAGGSVIFLDEEEPR